MPELINSQEEVQLKGEPDNSKVREYFYQRLTMFRSSIKYGVIPYGNESDIEVFKESFDIWAFGDHINNIQQELDNKVKNEEITTREDDIELIRRALERNGF